MIGTEKKFYLQIILWIILVSGGKAKVTETCPESISYYGPIPPMECWPMANRFCYCVHLRVLAESDVVHEIECNWNVALQTCSRINMTLVFIDTPEKNQMLEYFVTKFLGKRFAQIYWTGGAYNEELRKFLWFDYQEENYNGIQDFNYTNWAVDYPGKQLDGDECVVFNCLEEKCQWELGHCTDSNENFICEASLSADYKFPKTTRKPNIKKFSNNRSKSSNVGRNSCLELCFLGNIILVFFDRFLLK